MDAHCTIDGFGPVPVSAPISVAELRDQVRAAAATGQAIYPLGGRTMLDFGLPPTRPGVAIDLTGLRDVIEYPARDMTITVQAGIRIADVQAVLRAEYQRLPVDVPRADRATLGGAIACNLSGPRRYGFGTLRDYLIGISVVDAAGREVKGGGRVVKNVAGYDLCKLYTGSLGTLGIISQVTLKLRPLPEASALSWIVPPDAARLRAVLDRLAGSATRPVAIDLLSPRAAAQIAGQARQPLGTAPYVVVVGFEENAEAVAWQQAKLRDELSDTNSEITAIPDADAEWLWRALTAFQAVELGPVTFKANLLSSASVDLLDLVQRQPVECAVQLHAGSGVAYIHACGEPEMADVQRTAHALRECAVERRGNLVVRRSPAEWKSRLLVWGKPRGDAPLMAEVKRSLDPKGLLNPHRFVGD